VIEHVSAPQKQLHEFVKILEPQGHLCVQTPRADGIDLSNPEEHLHELHVPCHLHMYSEGTLIEHGARAGLSVRAIYRRWYVDSWAPFCSRRFIDLFMMAHGNDVDAAFDPPRVSVMLTTPRLWFYALFGYFLPNNKTDTMMVVFGRGTY
jgi:hypothetical protein